MRLFGDFTVQKKKKKKNSMSPFEKTFASQDLRSTKDVSPQSCCPQTFALVIFLAYCRSFMALGSSLTLATC